MAKQSAVSAVVARIDADLAKWREIESYVGGFAVDASAASVTTAINERVANLLEMRAYVTDAPAPAAEKPKRGRKPKRGLPAQSGEAQS